MPMGKSKKVTSAFQPYSGAYSTIEGLGSAFSGAGAGAKAGSIDNYVNFNQPIGDAIKNAGTGLQNNSAVFAQSPEQLLASINSGSNSYFNTQNAMLDQQLGYALDSATQDSVNRGLGSSTVLGAQQGQVAYDDNLRRLQLQQAALANQQQLAGQGLQGSLSTLGFAQNLGQQLGGTANQNFLTTLAAKDQIALANQQNQKPNYWAGALLGAAGSLAGSLTAPFFDPQNTGVNKNSGGSSSGGFGSMFSGFGQQSKPAASSASSPSAAINSQAINSATTKFLSGGIGL